MTDRGFINVDIFGQPMLAYKAVHEAHVAAEVIAGELQGNKELAAAAFNARVIPSVSYADPKWPGSPHRRLQPHHCQWPRRRRHQAAV